jgi:hypothetical protein
MYRKYGATVGLVIGLVAGSAVTATNAGAGEQRIVSTFGASGPDTCTPRNVWREATPTDHVCVDPTTRFFVQQDNQQPTRFRSANGGVFGPDTCQSGFVWREATPTDHLCVAPGVRDVHQAFNERAPTKWVATAPTDGSGFLLGGVPYPFYQFDASSPLHSSYSGRNDLVVDAATRTVQPDQGRPSQVFRFVRRGGKVAYQNSFQILDTATRRCLTVLGGRVDNGAGLTMEACVWKRAQTWHLQRRGDSRWEIHVDHSDKCLDAVSPSLAAPQPGAGIQQWECIGGQNQGWDLHG